MAIDETVQFGTLQVTPRVCNTRPQTEAPLTTTFVEVDEQQPKADQKRDPENPGRTPVKYEAKRIFSGWMFASSPGLHGVEHPVYDVWLVNCKGGKEVVAQPAPAAAPQPAADAAQTADKRGRTRKIVPKPPVNPEAAPIGPADEPVFNSTGAAPVDPNAAAQQQRGRKAEAADGRVSPRSKRRSRPSRRSATPSVFSEDFQPRLSPSAASASSPRMRLDLGQTQNSPPGGSIAPTSSLR